MINEAVFSALANPIRRQVVALLLAEDRTAGAIAEAFDISRSAVSEQVGVLRHAGLVREHKRGRQRVYSLNAEPFSDLRAWLAPYEAYWQKQLAGLAKDLEEDSK